MPQYIKSLKECVLEAYTCIVISVKEAGDTTILDQYVKDIFAYLEQLSIQPENDQRLLVLVVGLIADFVGLYGKKIQTLLALPFIAKLIDLVSKSAITENKKAARRAQTLIEKALK